MKIIWILVNCNSQKEAETIGKRALGRRLVACFDVFPRSASFYFWPPRKGKIEKARGSLLVLETMPPYFKRVESLIKRSHSDKLPFIGSLTINNISPDFVKWMKGELER